MNLTNALLFPARSVKSYKSNASSPLLFETVTAVAAIFALTSGSTIIFMSAAKGELVCSFARLNVVVYVTVVFAFCCAVLRLNVFEIVCPVSPLEPDPTLTFVAPAPSPKFQLYTLLEKTDCAPGLVAVLFVKVTGKPEVLSSFTPLTVESAAEYRTVCVE